MANSDLPFRRLSGAKWRVDDRRGKTGRGAIAIAQVTGNTSLNYKGSCQDDNRQVVLRRQDHSSDPGPN